MAFSAFPILDQNTDTLQSAARLTCHLTFDLRLPDGLCKASRALYFYISTSCGVVPGMDEYMKLSGPSIGVMMVCLMPAWS